MAGKASLINVLTNWSATRFCFACYTQHHYIWAGRQVIQALIFDFDGVIIDTETPDFTTWQDVFRDYGAELDLNLWTRFIGTEFGNFDMYAHLEQQSGKTVDRQAIRDQRRQQIRLEISQNPVRPGVRSYIDEAKSLGMGVGIASSSDRAWVQGHLESKGILELFDTLRNSDDVSQVKPNPELYLMSASSLNAEPNRSIAIEDSAHGVAAAKAAGMFCVAVPNSMTKGLDLSHADLRLDSLADLPFSELLEMASAR